MATGLQIWRPSPEPCRNRSWPTGLGLLVGLVSLWCYRYLTGRLSTIDLEMENASLDLLNQLSRFRGRFAIGPSRDGPMFGEKTLDESAETRSSSAAA